MLRAYAERYLYLRKHHAGIDAYCGGNITFYWDSTRIGDTNEECYRIVDAAVDAAKAGREGGK